MSWARLDDSLLDHAKLFNAGEQLGTNGRALALAMFTVGLMWSNKHLTDGHLPQSVVKSWNHTTDPDALIIAEALVAAGLWEPNGDGYVIHDFRDYNSDARTIKARQKRDRQRKHALTRDAR